MPDDNDQSQGPRPLNRGRVGAPLPTRNSKAPRYRGAAGGSMQPAQHSPRRTAQSPVVPLAERPECQPAGSGFRPHPAAPTQTPKYVGPPPTQARQQPAAEEPSQSPEPPTAAPPPQPPPQGVVGTAQPAQRNAPRYVTRRADTTPQYTDPAMRAAAAADAAAQPPQPNPATAPRYVNPPAQGGGARGLEVQVTRHGPPPSPQPSPPQDQPAMSRPMTPAELQEAANNGDAQAQALLRQMEQAETEPQE